MLRDARERYDVPVVEVIQPAVRRAVAATRNGRVGVIGTRGHGRSRAPTTTRSPPRPTWTLTSRPARGSSSSSRRAITCGPELLAVAHEYLDPVAAAGVDTLVLGCTHYPLLTGVISYVMGEDVTLVSSAEETAKDVYRVLAAHGLLRAPAACRAPEHRFLATGDPAAFGPLARRFLGPPRSARGRARRRRSSVPA